MKNPAFIRIETNVRNRVRRYCKARGLEMGPFVSGVIERFLTFGFSGEGLGPDWHGGPVKRKVSKK